MICFTPKNDMRITSKGDLEIGSFRLFSLVDHEGVNKLYQSCIAIDGINGVVAHGGCFSIRLAKSILHKPLAIQNVIKAIEKNIKDDIMIVYTDGTANNTLVGDITNASKIIVPTINKQIECYREKQKTQQSQVQSELGLFGERKNSKAAAKGEQDPLLKEEGSDNQESQSRFMKMLCGLCS